MKNSCICCSVLAQTTFSKFKPEAPAVLHLLPLCCYLATSVIEMMKTYKESKKKVDGSTVLGYEPDNRTQCEST